MLQIASVISLLAVAAVAAPSPKAGGLPKNLVVFGDR